MNPLRGFLILAVSLLSTSGCMNVSQAGYYWGNYSYTYLAAVRNPSPETIEKHIVELRDILAKSDEENLKPAPGVCAELAFWISKTESYDVDEVKGLYEREVSEYPESAVFIERLLGN